MSNSKLNYHDRSDRMWYGTKTIQDNDVIDCIGVIFAEYDIELLRLVELCVVYDEDEIGQ